MTIRAVTKRAGVAPQSFYLQFASLGEMLWSLYAEASGRLREVLEAAASSAPDPSSRLDAVARAYVEFALSNPGPYRALFGSRGRVHREWDPEQLPGSDTFDLLSRCVLARHPSLAGNPEGLRVKTTLTWTQLHGLSILMIDRPTFPWPPLPELIRVALL